MGGGAGVVQQVIVARTGARPVRDAPQRDLRDIQVVTVVQVRLLDSIANTTQEFQDIGQRLAQMKPAVTGFRRDPSSETTRPLEVATDRLQESGQSSGQALRWVVATIRWLSSDTGNSGCAVRRSRATNTPPRTTAAP